MGFYRINYKERYWYMGKSQSEILDILNGEEFKIHLKTINLNND